MPKKSKPAPYPHSSPWYLPSDPTPLEDTPELRRILASLPNAGRRVVLQKAG